MSSTASSSLTLELKPAWGLVAGLFLWLLFLIAAAWQSAAPLVLRWAISVAAMGIGAFILGSQAFSPSRAIRRAILRPEGQWILHNGCGRQWDAMLMPQTRAIRGCALLRWKSQSGGHWALVTAGSCGEAAFRRLRLRLRFS